MRKHQVIHEETDKNGRISRKTQTWIDNVDSEEPPFVKMYLKDMMFMLNMPIKYLPILLILTRNMNYNNQVSCVDFNKKTWCEELKIKINTFEHGLVELVKRGFIKRKSRGLYEISQQLFGKGKWQKIDEIDLSLKYNKDGREIHLNGVKGEKFSPFKLLSGE